MCVCVCMLCVYVCVPGYRQARGHLFCSRPQEQSVRQRGWSPANLPPSFHPSVPPSLPLSLPLPRLMLWVIRLINTLCLCPQTLSDICHRSVALLLDIPILFTWCPPPLPVRFTPVVMNRHIGRVTGYTCTLVLG